MMWHNSITFEVESDCGLDEFFGDHGMMRMQTTVKMIWEVTNGYQTAMKKTLICKGNNANNLESARMAFEDLMNARPYDIEMSIYNVDCPIGKFPWVLKIDHLPDALQELIRQIFSEESIGEMKLLQA